MSVSPNPLPVKPFNTVVNEIVESLNEDNDSSVVSLLRLANNYQPLIDAVVAASDKYLSRITGIDDSVYTYDSMSRVNGRTAISDDRLDWAAQVYGNVLIRFKSIINELQAFKRLGGIQVSTELPTYHPMTRSLIKDLKSILSRLTVYQADSYANGVVKYYSKLTEAVRSLTYYEMEISGESSATPSSAYVGHKYGYSVSHSIKDRVLEIVLTPTLLAASTTGPNSYYTTVSTSAADVGSGKVGYRFSQRQMVNKPSIQLSYNPLDYESVTVIVHQLGPIPDNLSWTVHNEVVNVIMVKDQDSGMYDIHVTSDVTNYPTWVQKFAIRDTISGNNISSTQWRIGTIKTLVLTRGLSVVSSFTLDLNTDASYIAQGVQSLEDAVSDIEEALEAESKPVNVSYIPGFVKAMTKMLETLQNMLSDGHVLTGEAMTSILPEDEV